MKLFQRLLVAPAALGLMAPIAANADTAAFTSTTTLSGSAYFTTGSVGDGGIGDNQEELHMQYAYGIDIDSSFTGEDLLHVGLEAGNAVGDDPLTAIDESTPLNNMDSAINSGDGLTVASMFYAFPVGDLEVTVGPKLLQDDVLAATTSAYSDTFRLGSMPFSQAGDEEGPGLAVSWSNDNGFVASASFISVEGDNPVTGINSDDADDVSTFTLGYNGDGWGGGLVVASNDGEGGTDGYDTFGGGIYYSPESIDATFSVAYDTTDPETGADQTDLFFGVDYEVGPGTLSAAYNVTEVDGNDDLDATGFEVSYSYDINDNVTITPGFFTVEDTSAGDDDSGVVVETTFSF